MGCSKNPPQPDPTSGETQNTPSNSDEVLVERGDPTTEKKSEVEKQNGPLSLREDSLNLGSRRELFVDHYLIDTLDGVRLELHRPQPAEVVLRADRPWEGAFNYGHAVIQDGPMYRIYYRGFGLVDGPNGKTFGQSFMCGAESRDGIHWAKPDWGLTEVMGTRQNNVIVSAEGDNVGAYAFIDKRPDTPADHRYKTIEGQPGARRAYVSPDGIHWRRLQAKPVIDKTHYPYASDGEGANAFWSESEGCYVGYYRVWVGPDRQLTKSGGDSYRWIGRCTSPDFVNWTKVEPVDFGELPLEHYYNQRMQPYLRAPHIYVGLPARFMLGRRVLTDEQSAAIGVATAVFKRGKSYKNDYTADCSDGLLVTSRGGNRMDRTFPEAFIRPGLGPEHWVSRTNYPLRGVVQTGPAELSIYVNRCYAQDTWHIQRFTLRLDGFISLHAPYQAGEMVTKPVVFKGNKLEINFSTSAAGHIRIGFQTADGSPLEGYSVDACDELIGDELDRIVTWNGSSDVSSLVGKPIRMRFVMKEADVYALQFRE
jgi:hypothetical protein